ncbi:hypothetical protein [Palleronia sp. LCG004]|uniref:hypothetical protein n=1 Tax=Palleronia sp. LCG004 TaxID=3079304 RepID=UPI002941F34B|nr:hypothetical protein [Palleronia sp. LCG004]WOI56176.1 hypothetical protein RVY76_14280 [Palleronia sp. LCG004]
MGRAVHFEDFDTAFVFEPEIVELKPDHNPDRAAIFDEGYAAGWDAAQKAQAEAGEQARQAVRSHLQDLSFTFHEARAHVMRSLHPMLLTAMGLAVPAALRATLGQRLADEIADMARDEADMPVEFTVSPLDAATLAEALEGLTALPATIREDAGLSEGQIHLRLGASAREIDLHAVERRIDDALRALDAINQEQIANG